MLQDQFGYRRILRAFETNTIAFYKIKFKKNYIICREIPPLPRESFRVANNKITPQYQQNFIFLRKG